MSTDEEPEAKKIKPTKLCHECKAEEGLFTCLREEQCQGLLEEKGSSYKYSEETRPFKCEDCAKANGRICHVCLQYQCEACEGHVGEWHPEANLILERERCDCCKKVACGGYGGFCYKECRNCHRVLCLICFDEKSEPGWGVCTKCEEDAIRCADENTGAWAASELDYCPKCKCEEHGRDSLQLYEFEEQESPTCALKKGDEDEDKDDGPEEDDNEDGAEGEEHDGDEEDEEDNDDWYQACMAADVATDMMAMMSRRPSSSSSSRFHCKVVIRMINVCLANDSETKKARFEPVSKDLDGLCGMVMAIVSQPDIHYGAYAEKLFFDKVKQASDDEYPCNLFHPRSWAFYKNGNAVTNHRGYDIHAFVAFISRGDTATLQEVYDIGAAIKKTIDDMPNYDSKRVPCRFSKKDVKYERRCSGRNGAKTRAIVWADVLGDFQTIDIARIHLEESDLPDHFRRNPEHIGAFWSPGTMGLNQARYLGLGADSDWPSAEAKKELSREGKTDCKKVQGQKSEAKWL